MSFELTFHDCSDNYKLEVEQFIADFHNSFEAIEVQTSGSTGLPKKITLKKKQLISSAERTNDFFNLHSDSSTLLSLSIKTIGGKMVLVRAMIGNYAVHVLEPTRNVLDKIPPKTVFNLISLAPVQFEEALNHPNRLKELSKAYLLGGASVSLSIEKKCIELELPVFVGFGMTETVSHIAIREINSSIYNCLEGVQISSTENGCRIKDALLELSIESTDSVSTDDGKHFSWLGRTDFVINSGGLKIHPELLEQSISSLMKGLFVIVGIPDKTWGERCVLVVESAISSDQFSQIQSTIKERFGKYAVPKAVILHSIPTINGLKINRRLIKEQLQ